MAGLIVSATYTHNYDHSGPIEMKLWKMRLKESSTQWMGVISRVSQSTDWVSSLVYSRKSSGRLRICLDPKDLNRAIKRPHYHTRTLEEITHKLAEATVFSKLDARHGYWSVSLDQESSMKTTFNSLFGRYRFLRLPFGLN